MHRTQIYFEDAMFEELKSRAKSMGISLSAYIRNVLKDDLEKQKKEPEKLDFSEFAGMWSDSEITLDSIREKAWK